MKAAVIGGKGYIGKHLAFYLNGRGHGVTTYDVAPFEEKNYLCVDMTNKDSVANRFGCGLCLHVCWLNWNLRRI